MPERSYRWLLWTLVLLGASVDQVSKYLVFQRAHEVVVQRGEEDGDDAAQAGSQWRPVVDPEGKPQGAEYVIVPGVFKLFGQFTRDQEPPETLLARLRTWGGARLPKVNQGALFGLGGEYKKYANSIFAVVSVAAALAIIFWSTRPSTARDPALCGALGLILAGTLGNLYDRLIFDGVRDFLYFHWFEWPVFNVADCCLVCGACLLLLQAFWGHPAKQPQESKEMALSAS
jgi:signal peptidase II